MPRPTAPSPPYRGSFSFGVPDDSSRELWVELHWAEVDGRAECVGIEIWKGAKFVRSDESFEGPVRPLQATDLRLPFAELVREGRQHMAVAETKVFGSLADEETWSKAPRVRGGPTYQEIAAAYEEEWQRSDSPTKAVAERFGTSKSAAAKWVAKCRDLGYLAPTQRGRPGGITPQQPRRK